MATGSLENEAGPENEVGPENKVGLENEVSLGIKVQCTVERGTGPSKEAEGGPGGSGGLEE